MRGFKIKFTANLKEIAQRVFLNKMLGFSLKLKLRCEIFLLIKAAVLVSNFLEYMGLCFLLSPMQVLSG